MPVHEFPDPETADENGIVAIGGDLHPTSLLNAYRSGIFPWPDPNVTFLIWASPAERGILEFKDLHVPSSLEKTRRKAPYTFTIDKAFEDVVKNCMSVPRPDQDGTWITREMRAAYVKFHKLGHAHSVEAWKGKTLVGGLYGVDIDGAFAGESMFYLAPNASKLALLFLIDHLKERGATWIDIQMVTPHMKLLGAKAIPRAQFLRKLSETRRRNLALFEKRKRK